jgi:hypothetical protein
MQTPKLNQDSTEATKTQTGCLLKKSSQSRTRLYQKPAISRLLGEAQEIVTAI